MGGNLRTWRKPLILEVWESNTTALLVAVMHHHSKTDVFVLSSQNLIQVSTLASEHIWVVIICYIWSFPLLDFTVCCSGWYGCGERWWAQCTGRTLGWWCSESVHLSLNRQQPWPHPRSGSLTSVAKPSPDTAAASGQRCIEKKKKITNCLNLVVTIQ